MQKTAKADSKNTIQSMAYPWLHAIVVPRRNGRIPLAVGPMRRSVVQDNACCLREIFWFIR
jgi:hypothetical protein